MGLRVMTYNVHRCTGIDRRTSPERIAHIVRHYAPDVVALQELDVFRARTNREHQVRLLADSLDMHFLFFPAVREAHEHYGDALLSRLPLTPVQVNRLPSPRRRRPYEPRAAIWAEIILDGRPIQIMNTHLGLGRRERLLQIQALLGHDWLGSPQCGAPLVLCGDFNTLPRSRSYFQLTSALRDCESLMRGPRRKQTFPASYPLYRIDYIFVSREWEVRDIFVPRSRMLKVASDHLPVIADLELPP